MQSVMSVESLPYQWQRFHLYPPKSNNTIKFIEIVPFYTFKNGKSQIISQKSLVIVLINIELLATLPAIRYLALEGG